MTPERRSSILLGVLLFSLFICFLITYICYRLFYYVESDTLASSLTILADPTAPREIVKKEPAWKVQTTVTADTEADEKGLKKVNLKDQAKRVELGFGWLKGGENKEKQKSEKGVGKREANKSVRKAPKNLNGKEVFSCNHGHVHAHDAEGKPVFFKKEKGGKEEKEEPKVPLKAIHAALGRLLGTGRIPGRLVEDEGPEAPTLEWGNRHHHPAESKPKAKVALEVSGSGTSSSLSSPMHQPNHRHSQPIWLSMKHLGTIGKNPAEDHTDARTALRAQLESQRGVKIEAQEEPSRVSHMEKHRTAEPHDKGIRMPHMDGSKFKPTKQASIVPPEPQLVELRPEKDRKLRYVASESAPNSAAESPTTTPVTVTSLESNPVGSQSKKTRKLEVGCQESKASNEDSETKSPAKSQIPTSNPNSSPSILLPPPLPPLSSLLLPPSIPLPSINNVADLVGATPAELEKLHYVRQRDLERRRREERAIERENAKMFREREEMRREAIRVVREEGERRRKEIVRETGGVELVKVVRRSPKDAEEEGVAEGN